MVVTRHVFGRSAVSAHTPDDGAPFFVWGPDPPTPVGGFRWDDPAGFALASAAAGGDRAAYLALLDWMAEHESGEYFARRGADDPGRLRHALAGATRETR